MKNSRRKPSKPLHLRDGGGTDPLTRWAENGALRTGHGGVVPGGGKGDKIPAKYEPGEFVVSNDMQDAAPGLREQLAELRGGVLAAKGMTPEQADARALHGGGLRAAAGFGGSADPTFWSGSQANQSLLEAARQHATPVQAVAGNAPMGSPDGVATKVPRSMTTRELFETRSSIPDNPNGPLKLPTPVGAQPTAPAPAPSLRAGMAAQTGAANKALYVGGRAVTGAAKLASALGPAAIGADVVGYFNDYKINDPGVDSSAGGTYQALRDGDFGLARRSLSKGALETGMDLGAHAAGIADLAGYLPGVEHGFATKAYNGMLRRQFGDQLAVHPDAQGRADPVAAEVKAKANASAPGSLRSSGDAMMSGQDPGWLNGDGANRVKVTRQANGVMEFSGKDIGQNGGDISYSDNRASAPRVSTVPGMSQADIDGALNNPDGSRWSGNDNAIMAANMRDGIDPYRGTSRGGSSQVSIMPDTGGYGLRDKAYLERRAAAMPLESPLASREQKAEASAQLARFDERATTLRGQDITERDNVRNNNTSLRNSMATNKLAVFNAQREQSNADRTHALAAGTQAQALGEKYRENGKKEFEVIGADGKPDAQASTQAWDSVRQLFPGMESANEQVRNQAMSEAKAMHGIFKKARSNDKVGWDALKFWNPKNPTLNDMPDAQGMKTEQVGFLDGLITPGGSNGDTLLKRSDGTSVNLGRLSAQQLEMVKDAQKRGWGNRELSASKNAQK